MKIISAADGILKKDKYSEATEYKFAKTDKISDKFITNVFIEKREPGQAHSKASLVFEYV